MSYWKFKDVALDYDYIKPNKNNMSCMNKPTPLICECKHKNQNNMNEREVKYIEAPVDDFPIKKGELFKVNRRYGDWGVDAESAKTGKTLYCSLNRSAHINDQDWILHYEKPNNMKQVKIDIPKGYEIDKEKSTFDGEAKIVFKKVGSYCISLRSPHTEYAINKKEYILFAKLVETCKQWNEIDGFVADWTDYGQDKYCIEKYELILHVDYYFDTSSPLHFKDNETAELFLETFRAEIEQVKHLI